MAIQRILKVIRDWGRIIMRFEGAGCAASRIRKFRIKFQRFVRILHGCQRLSVLSCTP